MKNVWRKVVVLCCIAMMLLCSTACGDKESHENEEYTGNSVSEETVEDTSSEEMAEDTSSEEMAEETPLTSLLASAVAGNEFQFGTYEQDNNIMNGAEPIEWIVLENDGEKVFAVSKYILAAQSVESTSTLGDNRRNVTWEVCAARQWLNDDFLNTAFSEDERACILETVVHTPDNTLRDGKGTVCDTFGGADTTDFVFLLSYEETEEYLKPLNILSAEATTATASDPKYEDHFGDAWVLRTPGEYGEHPADGVRYADCFLYCDGGGGIAGCKGGDWWMNCTIGYDKDEHYEGMRPAMWIKIK